MLAITVGGVLALLAVLIVAQMGRALGREGVTRGALLVLLLGAAWAVLELSHRQEPPPSEDQPASRPLTAQACFKCHESHYASWQQTYHRTMTREATPEFVKAPFDGSAHHLHGVTTRMIRRGDRYFMDTVDPGWSDERPRHGQPLDQAGSEKRCLLSVDRVVGSHWFQQLLHRDEHGRYARLPLMYHLVEDRWLHINGAFLAPDSEQFFTKVTVWNESCVYCHNTRVTKNPQPIPDQWPGYRTEVGELGISCEACHGAGEHHVRAHQNPARRLAQQHSSEADPTIVNPARLSVARSDDICARCHSVPAWLPEMRDSPTQADPFLAGLDLKRFFKQFWSEAERRLQEEGRDTEVPRPAHPEPLDARFWGDGTPLTTALEYQGMALSACYQGGHGELRCLTCHSMHQSDPNHQVKDGMRTNAACYTCHAAYRARLTEHTHHAADSEGSLCYNCHMPYQVYSLLTTHRSHRIAIPRVRDSLGTGKPHACNLCHLDKSLGWTQEQLGKWFGTQPETLADDDRTFASSLLHIATSDARTRAVVAGAFSWPPAQAASGRDWPVQLLTRTLEHERYQAVRYLAHRALRSLHGRAADDYDYQAATADRAAQLHRLCQALDSTSRPDRSRYPYLPLTAAGRLADNVFDGLLRRRHDPDVYVNE